MSHEISQRLNQIDLKQLVVEAVIAAKNAAAGNWESLRELAKKSAKGIANTGVMIAKMLATGSISNEEAKQLLEEEKIVIRIQLRSLVGVGLQIAQDVLNAIIGVFRSALNTVVGFALV